MTLIEAIDARRSRRKYLADPVEPAAAEKLETLARDYGEAAGVRIEFVWNDGSAFDGLRKTYGLLVGVRNYAGLIAKKGDPAAEERLGYYGELLLLHAVALGLGTCWVGGSFDRSLCPFRLGDDEKLCCTITVGPVREKDNLRERLVQGITHRKSKTVEEMMTADGPVPGWFMDGMRAARKAPSAVNRQPVVFSYRNGRATAGVGGGDWTDLGIAKLHFALGAGRGSWEFGNGGAFVRQNQ
jgi:nitroreductase